MPLKRGHWGAPHIDPLQHDSAAGSEGYLVLHQQSQPKEKSSSILQQKAAHTNW
jgi:hypothetical protein